MTLEKVEALPVGQITDGAGFHAEMNPVYQAHQTQSQCLASHLSAATVMTTGYWMFQVFSTLSGFALEAAAAACRCVTEQVSGSLQGCQDCPRRVRGSMRAEDQEAGPVGAPGQ